MFGHYVESAVFSSVQGSLHGKKSNAKYVEKPIMEQAQEKHKSETGVMDEEKKRKQVEMLFMQLQVRAHNFKQEQKSKAMQDGVAS